MADIMNPFDYDGALNHEKEYIAKTYVEEYSYTRFIRSPRNVFLIGERGSGKSITLIYNSLEVQQLIDNKNSATKTQHSSTPDYIGVYFQCNTPLTQKREHELLKDPYHSSVISEHFLVMSLVEQLIRTLKQIPDIDKQIEDDLFRKEIEYITGEALPVWKPFLESVMLFAQREIKQAQEFMNNDEDERFYSGALTFSSIALPIIRLMKRMDMLKRVHFLLMIDDAQNLNEHQQKTLNSWIAYRDRSDFSFKVALADPESYPLQTQTGGAILEGHDYIAIELEKPFQSSDTPFGEMAKEIIERRLRLIGMENPNVDKYL